MPRICVFAGAASGTNPDFATTSFEIGKALSACGYSFVYGAGNTGLMGAFADGVLENKGDIKGIIPHFLKDREVAHTGLTEIIATNTMHERKAQMYQDADGFLILPGGLGTLDETMEVLTWRQLDQLAAPVIIYSPDGYWQNMRTLFDDVISGGFAHSNGLGTIDWQDTPAGVVEAMLQALPV